MKCSNCGDQKTETQKALGHNWMAATCTAAKKCSPCGITEGNALGHTTTSGKCGRCGQEISKASQCVLNLKQPLYLSYFDSLEGTMNQIQEVTYTFSDNTGELRLDVYISGIIAAADNPNIGYRSRFRVRLISPSGKTFTETAYFRGMMGDSYTNDVYFGDLTETGTYYVEFLDYTR